MSKWQIEWDGQTFGEDDLTGAHASIVTLIQGSDSWANLDPFAGPVRLMAILTAFLTVAGGGEADVRAIQAALSDSPVASLLAALSMVSDVEE